ncbi:MAG: GHKL domain-containing protein [Clostridiales bacterium]|nr:GHKL domain-containing protein [Clostridiales bacterium]
MERFWIAFLYATAGTLPYRLLAYYPFRKQLRFSTRTVVLVVGTAQLLQSFLYAALSARGGNGVTLIEGIFAPACFVIFLICVQADRWKVIFLYVFVFDYISLVWGTARYLECMLFYDPNMTFDTLRSTLFQVIILGVTLPFVTLFLKRTKDKVFSTEAPSFWHVIWILPTLTTLIVQLYNGNHTPQNVHQFRFFLAYVLLFLDIVAVYGVLLRALDSIRHEAALEEKATQQENLLALQRTQYSQIARYMDETRQARHDLSQHLRLINQYLSTGDQDALREYVERYQDALPPERTVFFCKNYAVNTIVCYYHEEALQSGIDFSAGLDLPETLPISEPEFCSMLGNLLENALLSCRDAVGTAPFIRVLAKTQGDTLLLAIDNTCLREPTWKDGKLCSSRHDGFGLGTASVRTIASNHNGAVFFTWEDEVFYASVSLALPH